MFKRIFLHIGSEKTGSTSIQKYLRENESFFALENVVLLSGTCNTNNREFSSVFLDSNKIDDYHLARGKNSKLLRSKLDNKNFDKIRKEMLRKMHSDRILVITSEQFSSRYTTSDEVSKLYRFLSEFSLDIRVVCFLRDQVPTLPSLYSTMLKGTYTGSYLDFLNSIDVNHPQWNYLNLDELWSTYFENIIYREFKRSCLVDGDVVSDFLYQLFEGEVPSHFSDFSGSSNRSLSPRGIIFHQRVNYIISFLPFPFSRFLKKLTCILEENIFFTHFLNANQSICLYGSNSKLEKIIHNLKTSFAESNRNFNARKMAGKTNKFF